MGPALSLGHQAHIFENTACPLCVTPGHDDLHLAMIDGTWPWCVTSDHSVVYLAAVRHGLHLAGMYYTWPWWVTSGLVVLHLAVVDSY